ncbi:MAG: hypothetical protein WBG92_04955 [Thiohalocapsa sp.]
MTRLFLALVTAALVANTAFAGDSRTERVQFHKGASSATIEGRINGYDSVDYLLGARGGQSMSISMASDNGSNYFNIIPPGKGDMVSTRRPRFRTACDNAQDFSLNRSKIASRPTP